MSYEPFFSAALHARYLADERLTSGEFALLALVNLEEFDQRNVDGLHNASERSRLVHLAHVLVGPVLTNFCPPPVENDVALTVTAPATSGQVAGTPVQRSARMSGSGIGLVATSRDTVVCHVGTSPDSLMPSRIAAFSTKYASQHVTMSDITPTAAENKKARPNASLNAASMGSSLDVPAIISAGLPDRAGTRLSNLDLNGRLVKRGRIVSYHGIRFQVVKVNRGYCYAKYVDRFCRSLANTVSERLRCESVQVVT